MKLEEGNEYTFYVEGIITIPNEGDFYKLRYGNNKKILLKAEYYVKYNISIDNQLVCTVDKINCTGKIFLEPKHPFYSIGKAYPFKVSSSEPELVMGKVPNSLYVVDIFNNKILISAPMPLANKKEIQLKVIGIKKGKPILEHPGSSILETSKQSQSDRYRITGNSLYIYEDELIEMQSATGVSGYIVKKHYIHYSNLLTEDWVKCNALGHKNGLLLLEPQNPWYKVGLTYWFYLKNIYFSDSTEAFNVELEDEGGKKCGLQVSSNELGEKIKAHKGLYCRVLGFRKGRPQLEVGEGND
ncbi:MAG: hypothetical protein JW783_04625 [Bacteroidales bacterium]|nr:hypothetical protein [Bacteroidales bacterium]MBN2749172.1 hypothetical protein [Bacteroidales bacterium]